MPLGKYLTHFLESDLNRISQFTGGKNYRNQHERNINATESAAKCFLHTVFDLKQLLLIIKRDVSAHTKECFRE